MKRPNGIREWLIFIFIAVTFIASICIAYEALNQRQAVTETTIKKVESKVELHDTSIVEMKGDVRRIKDDVAEIKDDVKELLRK